MSREDLQLHYDQMWEKAVINYGEGSFRYDSWLDRQDDDRLGITLLLRPDELVKKEIQSFLNELQVMLPDQYYYPSTDIHLTVMSIISCYSGFSLDQIRLPDYNALLSNCLSAVRPFSIQFKGITAADAGIMIQGFPESGVLNEIRDRLREAFKNTSLQHSMDKRYRITTAHMTVMRFRKIIDRPNSLIETLQSYRMHDFGTSRIGQLELVFNDWYQRKDKVERLHFFRL